MNKKVLLIGLIIGLIIWRKRSDVLYFIYKSLSRPFVERWLWPTFLALGPIIAGICLEWESIRNFLVNTFPFLKNILTPFMGILAAALWATFFSNLRTFIMEKYERLLASENLEFLIEALDDPVKEKKNRFWKKFDKLRSQNPNKSTIFESITAPKKQIAVLTRSIFDVFQKYAKGKIQVVIFEYRNGNLKFLSYYPTDHPLSSPEELNKPNSTVRTAIMKKGLVVIPNIRDVLGQKFIVTSSGRKDGSIICYAFKEQRMGDNCWLVISIYSTVKGDFLDFNEIKESYEYLLKRFADRLLIEYALLNFKKLRRKPQGGKNEEKSK